VYRSGCSQFHRRRFDLPFRTPDGSTCHLPPATTYYQERLLILAAVAAGCENLPSQGIGWQACSKISKCQAEQSCVAADEVVLLSKAAQPQARSQSFLVGRCGTLPVTSKQGQRCDTGSTGSTGQQTCDLA